MIGSVVFDRELAHLLGDNVEFSNVIKMQIRRVIRWQTRRGVQRINAVQLERKLKRAINLALEEERKDLLPHIAIRIVWSAEPHLVVTAYISFNSQFNSLRDNTQGLNLLH